MTSQPTFSDCIALQTANYELKKKIVTSQALLQVVHSTAPVLSSKDLEVVVALEPLQRHLERRQLVKRVLQVRLEHYMQRLKKGGKQTCFPFPTKDPCNYINNEKWGERRE